jgi:hypothetical protein
MTVSAGPVAYRVDTTGAMPSFGGGCALCGRGWLTFYWLAPVHEAASAGVFEGRLPICHACTRALSIEPGLVIQVGQFGQWQAQRHGAPVTPEEATDEIKEQVRRAMRRGESPVGVQLGPDAVAAMAQKQRGQVSRIHILAGWISGMTRPVGFDEMAPLLVEQVVEATAVRVLVRRP